MTELEKPEIGARVHRFENGHMKTFQIKKWQGNKAHMTDGTIMGWDKFYGFSIRKTGKFDDLMMDNQLSY